MINKFKYLFICILSIIVHSSIAQNDPQTLVRYIQEAGQSPQDYLVKKFSQYDVILLGEQHLIRENLLFLQRLIPTLYANGIYTIGMEFGAYENQQKLDSLLQSEDWDEALAQQMMFHYNVTWAYREYVDVAKAAWEFNQALPKNAKHFRILNLSYIFSWDAFEGYRNAETMSKVFTKGTVDQFRARVIEKEVLSRNEKILALVGTPHAYTKYGSPFFLYNADNFYSFDHNWLGNRLYASYPTKVFNIILHQPFAKIIDNQYIQISPLDGLMEELIQQNGNKAVGFDLCDSPVGKLSDHSIHSKGYSNFTIGQLFDGYIFLKPLKELKACTVIDGFVNETNVQQAIKQFPDPDWHGKKKSLEELNDFIVKNAEQVVKEYGHL